MEIPHVGPVTFGRKLRQNMVQKLNALCYSISC